MAKKTFKIGEYAVGGVICVEATQKQVKIITKDWDASKGYKKSSDQSNAKELHSISENPMRSGAKRLLETYLFQQTTSYYADEIMKWIESKVKFNQYEF